MMIQHATKLLITLSGCAAGTYSCQAATNPTPRPAQHIYIGENYNTRFDARNGDTITMIMTPDGGQLDRCDHSGGKLNYNPYTDIYSCDGIDF